MCTQIHTYHTKTHMMHTIKYLSNWEKGQNLNTKKEDELNRNKEPKPRDKESEPRGDAMDLVIEDNQIL